MARIWILDTSEVWEALQNSQCPYPISELGLIELDDPRVGRVMEWVADVYSRRTGCLTNRCWWVHTSPPDHPEHLLHGRNRVLLSLEVDRRRLLPVNLNVLSSMICGEPVSLGVGDDYDWDERIHLEMLLGEESTPRINAEITNNWLHAMFDAGSRENRTNRPCWGALLDWLTPADVVRVAFRTPNAPETVGPSMRELIRQANKDDRELHL